MNTTQEANSNPTAAAVADSAPEPIPASEPAQPPTYKRPDAALLQQNWFLPPEVQAKLVQYHSDMTKPGATTTYLDDDGDEVTRPLKARETLRHAEELRTYGKLAIGQQKLDAAAAEQNGENKPLTLNDFVTPYMESAGDRMTAEAKARGLDCAAALPKDVADQICREEQEKYQAEHPQKPAAGQKKPFAIAPDQRNDWIIPQETQKDLMKRLVDMALPDGKEYQRIKPRARLMASRLLGRFCRLGQEQQFVNSRVHAQKPEFDWDAFWKDVEARMPAILEARRKEDEEFYKTHTPPPWWRPKQEN